MDMDGGKTSGLSGQDLTLLQLLEERLKESEAEKTNLKFKIDLLESKIKSATTALPRKPMITDDQIDESIRKLDFQRETSTLTLTQEKDILRQMEKYRLRRKELNEYRKAEEALTKLHQEKAVAVEQIAAKEGTLKELKNGLNKLKLAAALGINPAELQEVFVPVPAKSAPRVFGRDNSNMAAWEKTYGVALEEKKSPNGSTIVIQGTLQSINEVTARIQRFTLEEKEEMELTDAQLAALRLNRFELLNAMQTKHDVRLDISNKSNKMEISGVKSSIDAVRNEILNMDVAMVEILVEEEVIPALMGKGGVHFRKIEEDFKVNLNLNRESSIVRIAGLAEGVPGAAEAIQSLLSMNRIKEETIDIKGSHIISALLGNNAELIKQLQRDSQARLTLNKTGNEAGVLTVSGNTHKVDKAMEMVKQVFADVEARTVTVQVPEAEVLKTIIGKAGANIKQLRVDTEGAQIDIDWDSLAVRISHEDPEKLELAQKMITEIVDRNQFSILLIGKDAAIALKMQRGKPVRDEIIQEIGASLDIDNDVSEGRIKLRGSKEQIKAAIEKLEQFREMNHTVEVSVFADDESSLIQGGNENALIQLQEQTGAELRLLRQEHVVQIRGSKAQVEDAKQALNRILQGDDDGSVIIIAVDKDAMGPVIGKAGKKVKEIQTEFNIVVDVLRSRNQLRLRGNPEDVTKAKENILNFVSGLRIISVLKMPAAYKNEYARTVAQEFGVQIEEDGTELRIRGLIQDVADARVRMQELMSNIAVWRIKLSPEQMATMISTGETNFRHIKMDHNVSMELDQGELHLVVRGRPVNVPAAKKATYQMLDIVFQGQFDSVALPRQALMSLLNPTSLHELEKSTGCTFTIDRPDSCVRLTGEAASVVSAKEKIEQMLADWTKTNQIVPVEPWLLPSLIGKGGREINILQRNTGATIDVDRDSRTVHISGTEEQVEAAKVMLAEKIDKLTKESAEIEINPNAIGSFIGPKGANIQKIQEETGVSIDIDTERSSGMLKLRGPEEGITLAKDLIASFLKNWETNNYSEFLEVGEFCARALISRTGGSIRDLRDAFPSARIDVTPEDGRVRIQGSMEVVLAAKEKVAMFVEDFKKREPPIPIKKVASRNAIEEAEAKEPVPEVVEEEPVKSSFPAIPPGADPDMVAALLKKKPARRRKAKKGAASSEDQDEGPSIPGAAPIQSVKLPDQGSAQANNLLAMLLGNGSSQGAQSGPFATNDSTSQMQEDSASSAPAENDGYYVSQSGIKVRLF